MYVLSLTIVVLVIVTYGNGKKSVNRSPSRQTRTQEVVIHRNTIFRKEPFSSFLARNPVVPEFQRSLDESRVQHFVDKIQKYEEHSTPEHPIPFLNALQVGAYNDTLVVLDGQHRYRAMERYYNNYYEVNQNERCQEMKNDFNVIYIVRQSIKSNKALKELFRDLNDNFQIDQQLLEPETLDHAEAIRIHLRTHYPKHVKKSLSPRFPNINEDQVVSRVSRQYVGAPADDIVRKLEEWNDDLGKELQVTNPDLYNKAVSKQGLFLAMLFRNKDPNSLPSGVRQSVWNKQFDGNREDDEEANEGVGRCQVCNTKVHRHNFHAAHIIARANGGKDSVDNLIVSCAPCNLSMGTQSLTEYKDKYYGQQ